MSADDIKIEKYQDDDFNVDFYVNNLEEQGSFWLVVEYASFEIKINQNEIYIRAYRNMYENESHIGEILIVFEPTTKINSRNFGNTCIENIKITEYGGDFFVSGMEREDWFRLLIGQSILHIEKKNKTLSIAAYCNGNKEDKCLGIMKLTTHINVEINQLLRA